MPIIDKSSFRPHWGLRGGHIQTVTGSLISSYLRHPCFTESVPTPDGDFLIADWYYPRPSQRVGKLAIISHGLESSSRSSYVKRMIKALLDSGWTVISWNFRSCSGQLNRCFRLYHSGASDDLDCIVQWAMNKNHWKKIGLIGFSLGGNLTLKYAGECHVDCPGPQPLFAAIGISVPCDLNASARRLAGLENKFYMDRFLKSLKNKIISKDRQFPGRINLSMLSKVKTFHEFDEHFTAPIHGFDSALDYYQRTSSLAFLSSIRVPSLLINAKNDPFLTPECFPYDVAASSSLFHFEAPNDGGHVAFINGKTFPDFWVFHRAVEFLETWLQYDKSAA